MYLYDSLEHSTHTRVRNGKEFSVKSKKVLLHYKCNNCNTEFTRVRNGKPKETDTHFCKDCFSHALAQKETSKARVTNTIKRGKSDRGYKEVYVGKDYPYRSSTWIREHIYVMEQHIGKKIPKGMVVHHIDGDKRNNKLENLFLCTVAEHNSLHAKSEKILFELFKDGVIGFDRNKKQYYRI